MWIKPFTNLILDAVIATERQNYRKQLGLSFAYSFDAEVLYGISQTIAIKDLDNLTKYAHVKQTSYTFWVLKPLVFICFM